VVYYPDRGGWCPDSRALGEIRDHLVEVGTLISITGNCIKSINIDIVVARLATGQKGYMAERLWQHFKDNSGAN